MLEACHIPIADRLRSEIAKAITADKEQHAVTRQHTETHITAAMQNLKITQDQQRYDRTTEHRSLRLLESLRFNEINSRRNEVSASHPETFQWMYEFDKTRPGDSFAAWLKENSPIYWINGKPGSGKSTLMKFLVADPRTQDLLAQWSPDSEILILTFFFWLSGGNMQRSLKGFLCSTTYQILSEDMDLVEKSLHADAGLLSKRSIEDWSKGELRKLLMHSIVMLCRPICIFIDGLDEFDQGDDVQNLLSLIEEISFAGRVKICVSSRPEHYLTKRLCKYRQLRLQDLTAKDMRICIYNTLKDTRTRCAPASVDDWYLEEIVDKIATKADGVFLWVHYALTSLVRGMRNEENFKDLLDRIEELPSGMYELYTKMWNRLNGDEQRYRQEATTYFSYQQIYTLSLFEMLVALDPRLQNKLLGDLQPQDPSDLARECEALKTRVLTRCAGLLEVVQDADSDYDSETTSLDDISDLDNDEADTMLRNKTISDQGSLFKPASQDMDMFVKPDGSQSIDPCNVADSGGNSALSVYQSTKIRFLHRTAQDFVLNTEEGRKIIGRQEDLVMQRFRATTRARIGALVQGVVAFDRESVEVIMRALYDFREGYERHKKELVTEFNPVDETEFGTGYETEYDTGYETELLVTLRQVCQHRSISGNSERLFGYTKYWGDSSYETFESNAARYGFLHYIQLFVRNQGSYISPYYLGFLALEVADHYGDDRRGNLGLVSWLVLHGADIHAAHRVKGRVVIPALRVLESIADSCDIYAVRTLQRLLSYIEKPFYAVQVRFSRGDTWRFGRDTFADASWLEPDQIVVRMSINKLCLLVMRFFEENTNIQPQCRPDITGDDTKVVLCGDNDNENMTISHLKYRVGSCPSEEDSVYLGEALEKIWLLGGKSTTYRETACAEFERRLLEVSKRSPHMNVEDWGYENGLLVRDEEEPEDPYGVAELKWID
ncbi:MAG: hypothetical protein Q9171_002996 [Xanthocarpia ochracea]